MESKTKELVALGYRRADELKSCPEAWDPRSVAQLIIDLAAQLDVTAVVLREMAKQRDTAEKSERAWETTMMQACGEDGQKSVADKFAALEAVRDALAAENAELKLSRATLAENALETCNEVYTAGFRNTALHDGLMESTGNRNKYPNPIRTLVNEAKRGMETPATDAILREQMAKGVEAFAKKCSEKSKQAISSDTRDSWWLCGEHADDFAAQMRAGEAV